MKVSNFPFSNITGTALRKLEESQKKIAKLEGQILRVEQQLDTREQFIYFNRLDTNSKVLHLKRTIQVFYYLAIVL